MSNSGAIVELAPFTGYTRLDNTADVSAAQRSLRAVKGSGPSAAAMHLLEALQHELRNAAAAPQAPPSNTQPWLPEICVQPRARTTQSSDLSRHSPRTLGKAFPGAPDTIRTSDLA